MEVAFERWKYGFWKQVSPRPFHYDEEYKHGQATNIEMAYLRLGWLASFFTYRAMKSMVVVDIGSGNGTFVHAAKDKFRDVYGYDLCGESISEETLLSTQWDLVVLNDVLEHFPRVDHLFDIDWKHCFLSFPETPHVETQEELARWRHYKPDEHVWCLNREGVSEWVASCGCEIVAVSNFEDLIRRRWDEGHPNITSMLLKKSEKSVCHQPS